MTAQTTTITRIATRRATTLSRGLWSANAKYGPANHNSSDRSTSPTMMRKVRLLRIAPMSAAPEMDDLDAAVARAIGGIIRRLVTRLQRALAGRLDAGSVGHLAANEVRHLKCAGTRELVVILEAQRAQRLIVRVSDDEDPPRDPVQRTADVVYQARVAGVDVCAPGSEQVGGSQRNQRALSGLLDRNATARDLRRQQLAQAAGGHVGCGRLGVERFEADAGQRGAHGI